MVTSNPDLKPVFTTHMTEVKVDALIYHEEVEALMQERFNNHYTLISLLEGRNHKVTLIWARNAPVGPI